MAAAAPLIRQHEIRTVSLALLKPAKYNPRRMDPSARAALRASMREFGLVDLVVWNERSGNVVGGHQRLRELRAARVRETQVVVVDLDEPSEKTLNIALNSPKLAGEFAAGLQAILVELEAANADVFNRLRLGELGAEDLVRRLGGADPDVLPPPPRKAVTQLGDLWTLGQHRVLCGDATSADAWARLLGEQRLDLLVTDPPYGVDYGSKTRSSARGGGSNPHANIEGDAGLDYREWFESWLRLVPFELPSAFYVFMSSQEMPALRGAMSALGFKWHDTLIWVKNRPVLSRKDYNQRYEPIATGVPADAPEAAAEIVFGWAERHRFYSSDARTNVLEYDAPRKNDLHPTMKPVALLEQLITDGSPPGALVGDPFGGSGSTLIAAEMQRRRCAMMELVPQNVDVIVERWRALTGGSPQRIRAAR